MCAALVLFLIVQESEFGSAAARLRSGPPEGREAAWETLAGAGPERIPELERLKEGAEVRVKDWIDLAVAEIRFRQAVPRFAGRARRHTYSAKDRPASEVLPELQRMLGFPLAMEDAEADAQALLSLDVRGGSTGDVLLALARGAGAGVHLTVNGAWLPSDSVIAGPEAGWGSWRLRCSGYRWSRDWSFRGPRKDELRIDFEGVWDPAEFPLSVCLPVIQEATDAKGKDLRIPADAGADVGLQQSLHVELRPPSPGTRTLKTLRGYLPVFHARKEIPIEVRNPREGSSARREGVTLSILSIDPSVKVLHATLQAPDGLIKEDDAPLQGAWLTMPDGAPVRVNAECTPGEKGFDLAVSWSMPADREAGKAALPASLRVVLPIGRIERRVPFEFSGLELK